MTIGALVYLLLVSPPADADDPEKASSVEPSSVLAGAALEEENGRKYEHEEIDRALNAVTPALSYARAKGSAGGGR